VLLVFGLSPLALTGLVGAPVLAVLAIAGGQLLLGILCVAWFSIGWVWYQSFRTVVRSVR